MFFRKHTSAVMFFLGMSLAPLLVPGDADAIPAFSRQHKTECSTCHTIYPELNEFGDAFLKNGYVWPHKKGEAAKGAEPAGNEWSAISGLPQQIPISLTASADLAYDEDAADGNKLDLSARSITLQAGGSFRDLVGFFATYNLYSQGMQRASALSTPAENTNVPPGNNPDLDELFLVWRQAAGTPVNVKVGRFEPKLSLWKKSNRVLPVPSYASTTYRVGTSPFSSDATEDGVELNALLGNRLFAAAGVVDRNGGDRKDGYGHISCKIGGTDLKGQEPEVDLEHDSVWDFLSVTLGGFGYWGQNGEFDANGIAQNLNNFRRIGAEADILYKRLHLKGSGSFGRDSNPDFSLFATSVDSRAYTLEGEYYLGAPVNLVPLFRYEYLNAGYGAIKRFTPALAYAPLQNLRLSLEYTHSIAPEGTGNIAFASIAFSL